MNPQRLFLERLYQVAVDAAHPRSYLAKRLPPPPRSGRVVLLAAGKAGGSMVEVAESHYLDQLRLAPERLTGLAVTRHGYGRPTRQVPVIEAGHPVPDEAGLRAAERTLALAETAGADDLVVALISGGASANWIAPAAGLSLDQKRAVTRALLKSGAAIHEINAVRKHLSRIKGGRLAVRTYPAKIVTLALSDVPGDDPAVIGSGPTVPDPTTLADARAVIGRYDLTVPAAVCAALGDPANESPKPGDPRFATSSFHLAFRPVEAFRTVQDLVREAGYECRFLGAQLEGEAREVAADHARLALELQRQGRRAVILSGGELTVTIRGGGRGGPSQEYALALAIHLEGAQNIAAIAADTDGTDGGGGAPTDPAGAMVDTQTAARARGLGLDPAAFLAQNDSTGFFSRLSDLVVPGPTYTNVNDFRAIIIDTA